MEENNQNKEMIVKNENYIVNDLTGIGRHTTTQTEVYTNITDEKKLFNLENKVDLLLNDCENEIIEVKEVLIKRYQKPLKEPIINEETGEIEKEFDVSMSCVLVDVDNKSYATGSKTFTIQLMRYLQMRERLEEKEDTFTIKIIRKTVKSGNKALSFELV